VAANRTISRQPRSRFLRSSLPSFYRGLKEGLDISRLTGESAGGGDGAVITDILRILKFFREKAGNEG